MRRIAVPLAAIAALAAAAALIPAATPSASAADPTTITISSTSLGSFSTQMSSNNVWPGLIDDYPAAKSNFAALALPLVRLHVGDDGYPISMPEVKKNQWSFNALDILVNDETSIGQEPVMNIKFAPDWMWTCTTYQAAGRVSDQTFQTFAAYMARLVSYYNKGSMTTETGTVITNPAGTANKITYWELWNEPDLSNETPCSVAAGPALTPAQYLTMWNAVTPAMLAVDPTLKFVGPGTAGGQFGSTTGAQNDYITQVMSGANTKPYALSFHGYGYWDNSVSDAWIFNGDGSPGVNGGIDDIAAAAQAIQSTYPGVPMWISEINVNADWGADPNGRPWGPYAAAWWGSAFVQLAPYSVAKIDQFDIADAPQFGLLDDQTGQPHLSYWIFKVLNSGFPQQSTRLQASSPDADLQTMAIRRPDGKISVLVVNRRIDTSKKGRGLPADVQVALNGITPTAISLTQIDSSTPAVAGPTTTTLPATQPVSIRFPGYGLALLTISTGAPPPAPTISGFSPASGPAGASVTLTGTNLSGASSVKLGSVSASFSVGSATSISATVPGGVSSGKWSVTTSGGTATSAGTFTVTNPAPTVSGFSPASGPVGSTVTVNGTNFTGATSVTLGGVSASYSVGSATSITATVPGGVSSGTWAVTTPGGTATSASTFTVTAPTPTLSGFSPTSGPVGASVTLTGTNLAGASSVKLAGTAATFTVDSATSISATVPGGAVSGTWSVTTPGGTATSASSFGLELHGEGRDAGALRFSPGSGPVGTSVTLTGTNLTGASSVKLAGTAATFTVDSATSISATVPGGAVSGTWSVTTPGGTATSASSFTVTVATPTISGFGPGNGPVGSTVTLTGTNFVGVTGVTLRLIAATYIVNSATSITITVPPTGYPDGKWRVTTLGGSATSVGAFYTTAPPPSPTISTFSPTSGGAGASVTLIGTNLNGATSVKLGSLAASYTVVSATSIKATVPAGAPSGKWNVTTPGGTATSAGTFTVTSGAAAPTIASFSPTSGTVGSTVIITGTNFTGTTSVTLRYFAATFTVNSATKITVTVPATGYPDGMWRVTTPGGTAVGATAFYAT